MLQERDNQSLNFTQAVWCDNPKCNGDPRFCTCCIASSYSGSSLRKCIRITIRKRNIFVLLCNGRGKEDKQTRVLRTKEWENAARTPPYVCFSGNTLKVKLGKEQEEKLCRTPNEMGRAKKKAAAGRRWSSTQNNILLRRKCYCGNGNGTA